MPGKQTHQNIRTWLEKPVIPVIAQQCDQEKLLDEASLIFLQGCELAQLESLLDWIRSGKRQHAKIMLHIDLLAGLSSDDAGLRYLAGLNRLDGIITVRPHLVTAARKHGLASILLLFLQDGRSVDRGLHITEQSQPDAIELVPGVAALDTFHDFDRVSIPRIAGGLIRTAEVAQQLLEAGCDAISTSKTDLWQLNKVSSS